MATSKAVKIEYRKGPRKGESYVVGSEAIAKRVHPDATITGYESGEPYKARSAAKPEPEGLAAHTVAELTEMAKAQDISPLPTRKAELITALEAADESETNGGAE